MWHAWERGTYRVYIGKSEGNIPLERTQALN
jgi:hypothetical protein